MARASKGPGGGRPETPSGRRGTPAPSRRYTPPTPRAVREGSRYVPVAVATFAGLGVVVVVANYLEWLPGSPTNWWLVAGLGCFLAAILSATQWR